MEAIKIIMIVIGASMSFLSGIIFFSAFTITKNKNNRNSFIEYTREENSPLSNYSEEVLHEIVCKIIRTFSIVLLVGLLVLGVGITLVIIK